MLVMLLCCSVVAFAAHPVPATEQWLADWSEREAASGKLWQSPGENENDRVFSWLSGNMNNTFTYTDGSEEKTLNADTGIGLGSIVNTVKLYDLADGSYTYTYTADGKTYEGEFTVSVNDGSFVAMFCSDPQLGRSGDNSTEAVQNDTYGWERTLESAYANGAEIVLSTGDQVNEGFSLTQYNALFSPSVLKKMPFVPTAGNHDFYSPLFSLYFGENGVSEAGNDYYFCYGDVLFIVLDSNNVVAPVHIATINNAVNAFPEANWRVVMMHHGAYSSCADDFTSKLCAGTLTDAFDNHDIDLVLSGHNHFYSRTYPLFNGEISAVGTVYFEAGSASGGKCSHYDTSGAEYIVHSHDLNEASYSLLSFTEDTIEVSSYNTDTGEIFDTFTVYNTEKAEIQHLGIFTALVHFFEKILSFIPALFN